MKMYMVAQKGTTLRPINMAGMVTRAIGPNKVAVVYFKCWHRRKDAAQYIADQGEYANLYRVITLSTEAR